ncbi:hypothetical protein TanjilG_01199 [Lupinus angustifolius]|uniref:Uncharacterized protein n=1 Tax=Lupinus angustifolius TaxID=3871 RepID=A0A1J7GMP1_LUPAN|nr:hypothetical protein TanjilG_01199 [Lupinus angustifolius]
MTISRAIVLPLQSVYASSREESWIRCVSRFSCRGSLLLILVSSMGMNKDLVVLVWKCAIT